jgi:two-component system sensor histidine kinase MprB
VTVAVASSIVYLVMRSELRNNVDSGLRQNARNIIADIQRRGQFALNDLAEQGLSIARGGPATTRDYLQLVRSDGATGRLPGESDPVPVSAASRAVAAGSKHAFFADADVGKTYSRIYTARVSSGLALQLARPLDDVEHTLGRLRLILLLVVAGGIAAGAAGGALVARTALVPIRRLTETTERISQTADPRERVPEGGRDELGRLGTSFNTMLGALEESLETQRRFVADASHELRTPLTSMQTNIEMLKQQERLGAEQRQQLFADLEREANEMRNLITGLLELARGEDPRLERRSVQFDELVEAAVDRARARFPRLTFVERLEPTQVEGAPERLERAVWNLLENAGKWSAEGSTVEVTLEGGELDVRDHGPGIALEDRAHVFDRFYRAPSARSLPGSGLGLAIVREVAEAHGGSVSAEAAPGGGALLRLRLAGSTS